MVVEKSGERGGFEGVEEGDWYAEGAESAEGAEGEMGRDGLLPIDSRRCVGAGAGEK